MNDVPFLKYKIFNRAEKKMVPDVNAVALVDLISNMNGKVVSLFVTNEIFIPVLFTGWVAADGSDVYDEDFVDVEFMDEDGKNVERVTEHVFWDDQAGRWNIGDYDLVNQKFRILRVVGNALENPWPEKNI